MGINQPSEKDCYPSKSGAYECYGNRSKTETGKSILKYHCCVPGC